MTNEEMRTMKLTIEFDMKVKTEADLYHKIVALCGEQLRQGKVKYKY